MDRCSTRRSCSPRPGAARASRSASWLGERAPRKQPSPASSGARQSPSAATLRRLIAACGVDLLLDLPPEAEAVRPVLDDRLVVCDIGGAAYAFPLAAVTEVVAHVAPRRLPGQPRLRRRRRAARAGASDRRRRRCGSASPPPTRPGGWCSSRHGWACTPSPSRTRVTSPRPRCIPLGPAAGRHSRVDLRRRPWPRSAES